jgi:hypothetical protein
MEIEQHCVIKFFSDEGMPSRGTSQTILWGGVMLHFDNALVHNTEGVQKSLANFGFRRMELPPDTRDLAPCHFGAMEQAFAG